MLTKLFVLKLWKLIWGVLMITMGLWVWYTIAILRNPLGRRAVEAADVLGEGLQ